jgi:hypothetical protein
MYNSSLKVGNSVFHCPSACFIHSLEMRRVENLSGRRAVWQTLVVKLMMFRCWRCALAFYESGVCATAAMSVSICV